MENKIEIYQVSGNQTQVEVRFEGESVWLTQAQISTLFERERTVIFKHLQNIFKEGELEEKSNVQKMHIANSDKPVAFYNLDAIISVGYRVNSKRGIQFRQWATQRLKDYLVQGYAINQGRLGELQRVVEIIENTRSSDDLHLSETKGLLDILHGYTRSFVLLNQYGSHSLPDTPLDGNITYEIEYVAAKAAMVELKATLIRKKEATELFGNEKDNSFHGILGAIVQTFGGNTSIQALRHKQPIYCTLSSRIIRSATGTSALGRSCLSGF